MVRGRRVGTRARPTDDPALHARLRPGERVLAAARTVSGTTMLPAAVVGGTERALYLPDGVVLGWDEIERAVWHGDESMLEVVTLSIDGPARFFKIRLDDPGRLPELVRERVTASIVVDQHVALVGRAGAKIIARRVPGRDDLEWIAIYDRGVDRDEAGVKERVSDAVALLRRDLGV
jgi:hypothetical protein